MRLGPRVLANPHGGLAGVSIDVELDLDPQQLGRSTASANAPKGLHQENPTTAPEKTAAGSLQKEGRARGRQPHAAAAAKARLGGVGAGYQLGRGRPEVHVEQR